MATYLVVHSEVAISTTKVSDMNDMDDHRRHCETQYVTWHLARFLSFVTFRVHFEYRHEKEKTWDDRDARWRLSLASSHGYVEIVDIGYCIWQSLFEVIVLKWSTKSSIHNPYTKQQDTRAEYKRTPSLRAGPVQVRMTRHGTTFYSGTLTYAPRGCATYSPWY